MFRSLIINFSTQRWLNRLFPLSTNLQNKTSVTAESDNACGKNKPCWKHLQIKCQPLCLPLILTRKSAATGRSALAKWRTGAASAAETTLTAAQLREPSLGRQRNPVRTLATVSYHRIIAWRRSPLLNDVNRSFFLIFLFDLNNLYSFFSLHDSFTPVCLFGFRWLLSFCL